MKRVVSALVVLGAVCVVPPAFAQQTPTYSKDVAPILFANCTSCHRASDVAPMSLMNYKEVRPWARAIAAKVADGSMPPWHADPRYGSFANKRGLSDA